MTVGRVSQQAWFGLGWAFLGRDKDFWVATKPHCSMSRHDFPCVAT